MLVDSGTGSFMENQAFVCAGGAASSAAAAFCVCAVALVVVAALAAAGGGGGGLSAKCTASRTLGKSSGRSAFACFANSQRRSIRRTFGVVAARYTSTSPLRYSTTSYFWIREFHLFDLRKMLLFRLVCIKHI